MPLIAAAAIFAGAIEVSAVVAGLTYVSAGLYVAGKVTGNDTLMKLSAVTGLAAAGAGIYEGLSAASNIGGIAEGGSEAVNDAGIASTIGSEAAPTTASANLPFGVDSATGTVPFGAAADAADTASAVGSGADALTADAVAQSQGGSLINPTSAASTAAPPTAASAGGTETATNNLAGNTQAAAPPAGMINQPATGAAPTATSGDDAYSSAFKPGQAAGDDHLTMDAVDKSMGAGQGITDKARAWWGTLSPTEKLAASQFVAKGLGSIEDFVGPKAALAKAQAGLTDAQAEQVRRQTANMNQPAMKIPHLSYTFTQPTRG